MRLSAFPGCEPGLGGGRLACSTSSSSLGAVPCANRAAHLTLLCFPQPKERSRWAAEEHQRFLDAVRLYGRKWGAIQGMH